MVDVREGGSATNLLQPELHERFKQEETRAKEDLKLCTNIKKKQTKKQEVKMISVLAAHSFSQQQSRALR